jgi:hypothetical protein
LAVAVGFILGEVLRCKQPVSECLDPEVRHLNSGLVNNTSDYGDHQALWADLEIMRGITLGSARTLRARKLTAEYTSSNELRNYWIKN